jgi:hypothetical protein
MEMLSFQFMFSSPMGCAGSTMGKWRTLWRQGMLGKCGNIALAWNCQGGNFVARHMWYYCHVCLSSVMCCQLRNVQSDCVQDVTGLVCGVDVIDPGTWMRGKPDLAKRSVASMRWFKKRRPIWMTTHANLCQLSLIHVNSCWDTWIASLVPI